jgi:hypothetical protein
MTRKLTLLTSLIILLPVVFLSGCKTTTRSKIPVQLQVDDETLSTDLLALIKCQNVNVSGSETKVNGKHTDSEVLIEIVNPVNLPADQKSQDDLTIKIARLFKPALKQSNLFDTFKVLFVFQSTSGGTTSTRYTGHIWKSNEI